MFTIGGGGDRKYGNTENRVGSINNLAFGRGYGFGACLQVY